MGTTAAVWRRPTPTGRGITFRPDEIIVSKTDRAGLITYANQVFIRVSGYSEEELLGQPHSVVRHPDMPRCVFKLLWDTVEAGNEIFAYVKNMAKSGDHYWVHAHVTPTRDRSGAITGHHSNRRVPSDRAVAEMENLYRKLLAIEKSHADWRVGMEAAEAELLNILKEAGLTYDEYVFSLED